MYPFLGLGTVVKELFTLDAAGEQFKTRDSVSVKFGRNSITQADIDFARSYWPENRFTGRTLDTDGVTQERIDERIGVFDTSEQGYDDKLEQKVIDWMLAKANYGQDFVKVEHAAVSAGKPWASYDDTHHFKIPTLAAELGLVDEALAYERANKNRGSVIAGLEEKQGVAPQGEVIAA